jgi:hypothetical protein
MTQYLVFQTPQIPEGAEAPDPQPVMAALTEADKMSDAVKNVIGTLGHAQVSVLDASSASAFDVAVSASVKAVPAS